MDSPSAPGAVAIRVPSEPGVPDQIWAFGHVENGPLATYLAALTGPVEVLCSDELAPLFEEHHAGVSADSHSVVWFSDIEDTPEMDRVEGLRRLRLADADSVVALGIPGLLRTYESVNELLMAGGGYGIVINDEVVCAALTADTSVNHARLVVATKDESRRQGYATACMRRLVKAHHGQGRLACAIVPNRDGAGEMLARKVGFHKAASLRSYTIK